LSLGVAYFALSKAQAEDMIFDIGGWERKKVEKRGEGEQRKVIFRS